MMKSMTPFRYSIAVIILFSICTCYYIMPVLFIIAIAGSILYGSYYCIVLLLILLILSYLPMNWFHSDSIRTSYWLGCIIEYFDFKWYNAGPISEFTADRSDRFIGVWYPHSIVPLGLLCGSGLVEKSMGVGLYGPAAIASSALRIPLLRQLFSAFDCIDSNYSSLVNRLKTRHISILIGGIAELLLSNTITEDIYLKSRFGLIKLSLLTGAKLVPIYVYGHNQLFHSIKPSNNNTNNSLISRLSRLLGISLVLFYGRYYLPIPYRIKLTLICGRPIEVEQCQNPTIEQITNLSQRLIAETELLFHSNKYLAGPEWENKQLNIH